MQVLAMALGGPRAVIPNPKGWEIGVYEVELSEAGKDWLSRVKNPNAGGDVKQNSESLLEDVVDTKSIVSRAGRDQGLVGERKIDLSPFRKC